ncbi:MAG TPA: NAD(P)-dependent oxidoreductase, partial [Polyangia bacterium]
MNVLVAGASGTIGRLVVRELIQRHHSVVGLAGTTTRLPALARLGAEPIAVDLLDPAAVAAAVTRVAPDAVVDVATRFPGSPMRASDLEPTNRLREHGTRNLLAAAIAAGARRFVCESMIFIYGWGPFAAPVGEEQPPGRERSRGLQRIIDALASSERQVRAASEQGRIEGVSLRFGLCHGAAAPSTQRMVELVRRRRLPLLDGGHALHS